MIVYDKDKKPAVIMYAPPRCGTTSTKNQIAQVIQQNQHVFLDSPITKHTFIYSPLHENIKPTSEKYRKHRDKMSRTLREVILVEGMECSDEILKQAERVVKMTSEELKNAYKILNVRNPLARLSSMYKFANQPMSQSAQKNERCRPHTSEELKNFSSFIDSVYERQVASSNFSACNLLEMPIHSFCTYEGELQYDAVIRIEEFQTDWNKCHQEMREKFQLKDKKISFRHDAKMKNDWRREYQKLRSPVVERAILICQKDADLFGYNLRKYL